MPTSKPILQVNDLSVRFFLEAERKLLPALNRINFQVNEDEVLGIIGESGSGKSITLLSILGLLQTHPGIIDGEIVFNTQKGMINTLQDIEQHFDINHFESAYEEITEKKTEWKKSLAKRYKYILGNEISMVFQNPRLAFNPYYSIGKQISESILLHKPDTDKESAKSIAIDWLRRVKMEAPEIRYNNNPYGLSGGLCQRAMIAMALASEPRLLIADEPTTGLDATIQGDILTLLDELKTQQKLSMIIVSHDFNVMHRLADRVLVYYKGFIIEEGNTEDILKLSSETHHPYTTLLLDTEFIQNTESYSEIKPDRIVSESYGDNDTDSSSSFFTKCPYANDCRSITPDITDKCSTALPPLISIKGNKNGNHKIRCWKYQNA
ncbi:MAG: ABC transporter ATP-binding protein [Gammaproteobacteria bacterium]|nr:ABC transporter ATP-binding protein [Gammaproteobacteria bacterium]